MVQSSTISLGHARALLSLESEPEMLALAKEVAADGLSVREVERRVRVRKPTPAVVSENRTPVASPGGAPAAAASEIPVASSLQIKRIEDQLRRRLQTDVRVNLSGADKGTVAISFFNPDDLERLLDLILGVHRDRH
jgi:ParB family chromosome partitioning protein